VCRLASYSTFWLVQPRGRCTRAASPSRHTASPVRTISESQQRRSSRVLMRLPSGWQCPSAASGPSSRCDLGLGDADRSPGAAVRQPVEDDRPDGIQGTPNGSGGVPPRPGGRGGLRWARRRASQASTWAGSDERGPYDNGTRSPGRLQHLAYGLVPLTSEHTKHHPRRSRFCAFDHDVRPLGLAAVAPDVRAPRPQSPSQQPPRP
jgi:hypothetical protein